jgi:DNA ligase (NAD+)
MSTRINRDNPVQPLDASSFIPNILAGKTIIVTGTLEHFSRKGIEETIKMLGGVQAKSVSSKLDFILVGDSPGSKLAKAQELGVRGLTEKEFVGLISK